MIEWVKGRLGRMKYAFIEFPELKWLSIFNFFIFLMSIVLYQPLMVFLYKLNLMGGYLFQDLIQQNVKLVIWGQFIVPLSFAIWGYFDVVSSYESKHLKKYKQLPKWAN
ncbi:hypothetical protein F895_01747 [Acinetobacter sp. CIP 64.2]|uniref:hypothetical protein n=1 Tax=unclassified Acinetobacter TaxID=196816 RepID=UPI000289B12D|nr:MULTISPECIES: hypothetical protein [unclassified Acinetobacter]ENX16156.1 hypothetical protein F895_01747 [Acinetobacter sp. CIP 64.2]